MTKIYTALKESIFRFLGLERGEGSPSFQCRLSATNPYAEYLSHLSNKYPVPDVKIDLQLSWTKHVYLSDQPVDGYISWVDRKNCIICVAIGAADRTIKDNLVTLGHEFKHFLQYYVEGIEPSSSWSYEFEAPAYQFSKTEIEDYLTEYEYNTEYLEPSMTMVRRLRQLALIEGRTIDSIIEDALSRR